MPIRIQSIAMASAIRKLTQIKLEAKKNGDKDGKALYKLMNHVLHSKTMENLKIQNRCKTRKQ